MSYLIKILIFFSLIFIFSCTVAPQIVSSSRPDWIFKPSGNGYIGGVGICGTHIKGKTGQRDLAVSRALDEIARQLGVRVDSVMLKNSENTADSAQTSISTYSIHTVDGKTVSAKIVESWIDTNSNELYIYMVMTK